MNNRERQRFEREIDEIIAQKGGFLTGPKDQEVVRRKQAARKKASPVSRFYDRLSFNPGRLVMSGIALLLIVGLLLWTNTLQSLQMALIVVAVGLFVVGYVLSFTGRGGVYGGEKRWRGQVIDDTYEGPSFDGLKRLFKRKKK